MKIAYILERPGGDLIIHPDGRKWCARAGHHALPRRFASPEEALDELRARGRPDLPELEDWIVAAW